MKHLVFWLFTPGLAFVLSFHLHAQKTEPAKRNGTPLPQQAAYLESHPPQFKKIEFFSQYVTMPDGVKLAVDVYLPKKRAASERLPTILYQTRYVRSVELKWAYRWLRKITTTNVSADEVEFFVQHGYAVVVVDTRGSGASYGTRQMEFSPQEVEDGAAVCDWIVEQPWSDGTIGTSGVSYVATTALGLLKTQHPAVKACIPRSGIFDLYMDAAYTGGLLQGPFVDIWGSFTQDLDMNNYTKFAEESKQVKRFVKGTRPVDTDKNRKQLQEAAALHAQNFDIIKQSLGYTYRDDSKQYQGVELTIDDNSVHTGLAAIREGGVPILWISGWYDGAITRSSCYGFVNLPKQSWLVMGPWDHGPHDNASPYAEDHTDIGFHMYAEMLRFFNYHLRGEQNSFAEEAKVRYFAVGEEAWHTAQHWPPTKLEASPDVWAEQNTWPKEEQPDSWGTFESPFDDPTPWAEAYLHPNGHLKPAAAKAPTHDKYTVNYSVGTGGRSRYNSVTGLYRHGPTGYDSLAQRLAKMQVYRGEPLNDSLAIAGHPVASFVISADATDAALFVYLLEETAAGDLHYITEGVFRALHRKVENGCEPYCSPVVHHTYRKADGKPLQPNEKASVQFGLLPIAYTLAPGSRLVVAVAGHDKDHFNKLAEAPTALKIYHGKGQASAVQLPIVR